MVIGLLQFELLIHDAQSLKDKRRVVQSVKDRLHREHQVAVAEVDRLESPSVAVLALAMVASEGKRAGEVLDSITLKLRELRDAELGDVSRQVLQGEPPGDAGIPDPCSAEDTEIADQLTRRAHQPGGEEHA